MSIFRTSSKAAMPGRNAVGARASNPHGGRPSALLLTLAFVAFVSLGLPDGILGVTWPSLRETFSLPVSSLGVLLAAMMGGYLVSSFMSGFLVSRLGVGHVLFWSSVLMVSSLTGYAVSPAWPGVVLAGVLAGLGAGAIDAGINAYAAENLGPRLLTWLHASYGLGATAGPLVMTSVLVTGITWRWGYAIVGAALLVMAVAFAFTTRLWDERCPADCERSLAGPGLKETLGRPLVQMQMALFFVYAGLEVSAGQWSYSLLTEARSVPAGIAGVAVSAYWGGLTLGRILAGPIAEHVSEERLLRASMTGALAGALLIWAHPLASILGLIVMGLALAPIYPLLMAVTPGRVGRAHSTSAVGFQVAAGYFGTAVIPGVAGFLARSSGTLEVVGPFLFGTAIVLLLLHEAVLTLSLRARTLTQN